MLASGDGQLVQLSTHGNASNVYDTFHARSSPAYSIEVFYTHYCIVYWRLYAGVRKGVAGGRWLGRSLISCLRSGSASPPPSPSLPSPPTSRRLSFIEMCTYGAYLGCHELVSFIIS